MFGRVNAESKRREAVGLGWGGGLYLKSKKTATFSQKQKEARAPLAESPCAVESDLRPKQSIAPERNSELIATHNIK